MSRTLAVILRNPESANSLPRKSYALTAVTLAASISRTDCRCQKSQSVFQVLMFQAPPTKQMMCTPGEWEREASKQGVHACHKDMRYEESVEADCLQSPLQLVLACYPLPGGQVCSIHSELVVVTTSCGAGLTGKLRKTLFSGEIVPLKRHPCAMWSLKQQRGSQIGVTLRDDARRCMHPLLADWQPLGRLVVMSNDVLPGYLVPEVLIL